MVLLCLGFPCDDEVVEEVTEMRTTVLHVGCYDG